jgi:hypothetical protein
MARLPVARPLVGAAIAASTACTLWAAIDDPYKGEAVTPGGPIDGAADSAIDAGADAANHILDAGFVPYAIAARGDTLYIVDNGARVHVAYDAGMTFETFWDGDAGSEFVTANKIAASAAGVFWTVSKGVRYCALDGGACGLLPRTDGPTLIAASDSVVAWVDDGGITRCTVPLSPTQCIALAPSSTPNSVAVGQDGTVAWVAKASTALHFNGPGGRGVVTLPAQAQVIAADVDAGNLYWIGSSAVGLVPFDALVADAGSVGTTSSLALGAPPTQIFAAGGAVYWSLPFPGTANQTSTALSYCPQFVSGGVCSAQSLPVVAHVTDDQGIAVTSRWLATVATFPATGSSELWAVPAPPVPGK